MSEEDRKLLAGYLTQMEIGKTLGVEGLEPVTGRTVGEVMVDAMKWKARVAETEAAKKKKDEEATALKAKVLAERKAVTDKLGEAVTVALVGKRVAPKDYSSSRLYDFLSLDFAVENKTDRPIRQMKGIVYISDATGTELGSLIIDFNRPIGARATIKTDTGYGWQVRRFSTGTLEKIADAQFDGIKSRFEVEVIAYKDGEIIKAPEVN
jgi:hypothetical protein